MFRTSLYPTIRQFLRNNCWQWLSDKSSEWGWPHPLEIKIGKKVVARCSKIKVPEKKNEKMKDDFLMWLRN